MVFDTMEKSVLINEQESKLVESELKKQRTLSYFLSAFLLLLITFSIIFYKNNRVIKQKSEEIKKKKENIEWLLKEIHHRVKNNLQMIVGLLELQHTSISDEHASMVLNDASSRVKSIALIHQNLYSGDSDIVSIGFKKYVEELINNLLFSYKKIKTVEVELDIDELKFSFDKAVIFGLLITELVTNVLKHAFLDNPSGRLNISVKKDLVNNEVKMQIKDDGIGLPENFSDKQDSLGMDLIQSLVKDLNGTISFQSDKGTTVSMNFKQLNL